MKDCSWNHALWECPKRGPVRLNPPESGLLKRYGWSELEPDPVLIQSMVATVLDMWNLRSSEAADAADSVAAAQGISAAVAAAPPAGAD